MSYSRGFTKGFACPICGGWIPGYSVFEKEVWEQMCLPTEKLCDCGSYEAVRDVMLAVYNKSRVEALRAFREAARQLHLPDPDA